MRMAGAALIIISLAGAVACGPPPPPVPSHADATAGLRISIGDGDKVEYLGTGDDAARDDETAKAMAAAQHALVTRLESAGYVVVTGKGPWDLTASTTFTIKRVRHEDPAFGRARIRLRDRKGNVIDEITLEYRNNTAPTAEPDRVAVSLVNEMNSSLKLSNFAQKYGKHRAAGPADAGTQPTSAPDGGTQPPNAVPTPSTSASPSTNL